MASLKIFIEEVITHFLNRASQREHLAYRIFDIHKKDPEWLQNALPNNFGKNRNFVPSEINVLIGYYKNQAHLDWISENGLYNIRTGTRHGAIPFTIPLLSSKYLLLHTKGDIASNELWEIVGEGPRVFSSEEMKAVNYETENTYLVFEVRKADLSEFNFVEWDFRGLSEFGGGREAGVPFTVSLTELMGRVV